MKCYLTLKTIYTCLHFIVFLARVNHVLTQFMEAWNNHPLSSCHNMTPMQLWIQGLCNAHFNDQCVDQVNFIVTSNEKILKM